MRFCLSAIFYSFLGLGLVSCQTMEDTLDHVVDVNSVRSQQTVLHPLVSKSVMKKLNEGPRKVNRMTPIFTEDRVIVGSGNAGIASITLAGQTDWETAVKNGIEAPALMIGAFVYAPANDGNIYKIDAKTGAIVNQVRTGSENLGEVSSSADGKTLYAQNSVGTVFSINTETLKVNWSFSRVDTSPSTVRGTSKVVWTQNKVFTGMSDGSVVALDANSGQVIWEKNLNRNKKFRDIDASPLIDNGKIYISAYDEKTYCLDLNGQILWQVPYGGFAAPSALDDTLFIPTSSNQMVALEKSTGALKWTFKTVGIPTEMKFIKGYGIFGSSLGPMYLVDVKSGKEVAHFEPGRGILSSPAIKADKDLVAFVSGEAVLYILQVRRQAKD